MLTVFTEDDIVRYIYRETSEEENEAIATALLVDSSLRQCYTQLMEVVKRMDTIKSMKPSASSVDLILEHSREASSQLETSF